MPRIANRDVTFRELMSYCCCPPSTSSTTSKLAFMPPEPSYDLCPDADYRKYELVLSRKVDDSGMNEVKEQNVWYTKTKRNTRVAVIDIDCCDDRDNAKYSIIYSHGNKEDIGTVHKSLVDLSRETNCEVYSYDYSGYGRSSGKATDKSICLDIEAAWTNIAMRKKLEPERVILIGYSIGSVPTIHLANRIRFAGIVLVAPLASSKRILCKSGCPSDTMNK